LPHDDMVVPSFFIAKPGRVTPTIEKERQKERQKEKEKERERKNQTNRTRAVVWREGVKMKCAGAEVAELAVERDGSNE